MMVSVGWADDERFLELSAGLQAFPSAFLGFGMSDYGTLHRKPLDVLRFLREKTLGNQQREVGVDMPRLLESAIEVALNRLPDGKAFRANDHTAFDRARSRQSCAL